MNLKEKLALILELTTFIKNEKEKYPNLVRLLEQKLEEIK